MTLRQISNAFRKGHYKITLHARQQMASREVYLQDLAYAFEHGEIIKKTPHSQPYPKVHIAAVLPNAETLIVIVSKPKTSQKFRIVTVFFPDENGEDFHE